MTPAAAFANQLSTNETGLLFIGVANDGTLIGVDDTDALQKRVRKACQQYCYPEIEYTISDVDAHFVRLYDIGLSEYFWEPLLNVDIARDEKRHRPLLIVRQRD